MKLTLTRVTKNKLGIAQRTDEIIDAEILQIGRGTNCNIHLTDARVALHHATITKNSQGSYSIEALSTMLIDASTVTVALLKEHQQIQLGPYTLQVLKPKKEADLALSIELTTAAESAAAPSTKRYAQTLKQTWLSRRLFSWLAVGVVALAFIVAPVYYALHAPTPISTSTSTSTLKSVAAPAAYATTANIVPTDAWNPGPLDSSHANFGRDCKQCHQTPFVQVENSSCENCHKTIGWHFALDTPAANKLHESVFANDASVGRCASCHRDHKGINALKRQDSPLCTDCHRDVKTRHETLAIPNITDFTSDHPPFKLSMLVAGKTGKEALIRVSQDSKPPLVEKSNLKFPHDVHLSKKGVRAPNATGSSNKEILTCKNCHTPDETGTRFKPISMKEHCQDCHSLAFEPAATTREVPHGSVDDVVATVNEFYAQAALFNKPIDAAGSRAPQKNAAWVKQKANAIVTDMMEKQACFSCHTVTKTDSSWAIAPIAITQHWLPKSRFPHAQHSTHECASCHDAAKSKTAADILIPDIKNCQSCHAGNVPVVDKTLGTCQTCHGFHVGGSGAGTPVVLPKSPTTKSTSKPTTTPTKVNPKTNISHLSQPKANVYMHSLSSAK
jgi:predicted CXXCH cytochrome family protein